MRLEGDITTALSKVSDWQLKSLEFKIKNIRDCSSYFHFYVKMNF